MIGYIFAFISIFVAILVIPHDLSFLSRNGFATVPAVKLISKDELSLYDGEDNSKGLHLAILGQVFDVEKGRKHYGPGGGYHSFAGKDASLSFVTGDFSDIGLIDDVSSLAPSQVVALYDWLAFYQKDYKPVGRLVGHFYTVSGQPTEALQQVESALTEGLRLKALAKAEREQFPACNSEWSGARGGRVWCSTQSGGVNRNWTGVPRKLFTPGSSSHRCVCVENSSKAENPNLKEYEDCAKNAESCPVPG
ncbi:neuferricin [Aplochiton taeniatus]